MNTKNNARRRDSVARIKAEFIELLQTKELSEITVSELCKRCRLNRSTFYANFEDVYALADALRTDLEQQVFSLYTYGTDCYFEGHDYLPLFRHMRENALFYKTYFKLGYDTHHSVKLYDIDRAVLDFANKNINYHIAFFQSGFNAIVKLWLFNGCKESPEEMDEIIRSEYRGRS